MAAQKSPRKNQMEIRLWFMVRTLNFRLQLNQSLLAGKSALFELL
jgi:hypothetical protein